MKKIIFLYYLVEVIFNFGFGLHFTSYVIFLKSFDLSFLQINLVNFFFMIGVVLMEVPTGIFADIFSRKKSYTTGVLICSLGFLSYFMSQTFWTFVLSESIIALGMCFISGSLDAWLISELKIYKQSFNPTKIFSTNAIFTTLAQIISGLCGALIASVNLSWSWLLGAIILFILFLVAHYFMPDNFVKKSNGYKEHLSFYKNYSIDGLKEIKNNRSFLFLAILAIISALAVQPINMFWQPFFKDQYSIVTLGWLWLGIKIFTTIGGWLARKIPENKIYQTIWYSQIITSLPFLLLPIVPLPLLFFLIHEIGRGMESPLRSAYFNLHIQNEDVRATILSYDSMAKKMGAAIGLFLSGLIADSFGILLSWFIFPLFLFISVLIFLPKIKNLT